MRINCIPVSVIDWLSQDFIGQIGIIKCAVRSRLVLDVNIAAASAGDIEQESCLLVRRCVND